MLPLELLCQEYRSFSLLGVETEPQRVMQVGEWVSGQAIGSTLLGCLQVRAVYDFLVCVRYQKLNPEPDACEAATLSLSGIQALGFCFFVYFLL